MAFLVIASMSATSCFTHFQLSAIHCNNHQLWVQHLTQSLKYNLVVLVCLVGYVCIFLSGAGCVGRRCYCLQANWSCTCEAGPFWSQADSGEATGLHQQRNVCCGCCVASAPSGWVCRIWPLHWTRLRSRLLRMRFGGHGEQLVNSQPMFMLQSISGWLAKMANGMPS